jgi:hypothetical protein
MGLKIVPNKLLNKKKTFYVSSGFPSSNTMADEDADILIKYKAIKKDKVRFANAQQVMQLRGY